MGAPAPCSVVGFRDRGFSKERFVEGKAVTVRWAGCRLSL